jgi:pimeloyl-ACP methyl ester carboxylesterase
MDAIFVSPGAEAAIHERYGALLALWPQPNTQRVLPTRQGETFVIACGPERAPPVMLLHASGSVAGAWMGPAGAWAKEFRLYAVDMIGEAGFSAPSRPPLASDAYALWLDDVLAGLGVQSAAFVGVSLGGWLALDYAHRRPGRVRRMGLIGPAGIGRRKHATLREALLSFAGPGAVSTLRGWIAGRPWPGASPARQALAALMAEIGRGFRPRTETIPILSDAVLRSLTMPILAIVGGRDLTIDSAETRRRLARFAPHADVRFLPQAGHYIAGQAETIARFLRAERA